MVLRFSVPGRPVPKQRPRVSVNRKGAYAYTPERTRQAEAAVGWAAKAAGARPGKQPVAVRVAIYVTAGPHEPDADNAAKLVLDACNGIVWADDRQVRLLVVHKRYVHRAAEQRTEVEVRTIVRDAS